MTKKLILLLATCLITTSCLFGCGDDSKPSDDNPTTTVSEVESTTKEDVATTEPTTTEPTTEEPTTEEPSTEYVYKGQKFAVSASLKDYFMDLTIQKGDKISLNELIGESDGDEYERGYLGIDIMRALYRENHIDKYEDFVYTYQVVGTVDYSIPFEKNVIIEYNENEKMYFHFVRDRGKYVDFDVYVID